MVLAGIMTEPEGSKYSPQVLQGEIDRIDAMINSGKMKRYRQQARSNGVNVIPKNASSIILIKGEPGDEKIVMGKRNMALKFMPGALVFPGGRVDRGDGGIKAVDQLHPETRDKLLSHIRGKSTERRAHALGVAAIRELAEETGLLIGAPSKALPRHPDWQMFHDKGMAPSVSRLRLLARAVTPPGVHRRFDTWFFVMRLEPDHHIPNGGFVSSGELENLQWIRPQDAIRDDTREITRVILVELMNRLQNDPHLSANTLAPSYETRRDRFLRKMM
jgi:8-oxo-dGTP pyrophosphatase MutT (NUDIX family)